MRCPDCGQEAGITHNCAASSGGVAGGLVSEELQVPANAGLIYYLGEALKIVRWDDAAVRRNAKDPRATWYGLLFWTATTLVIIGASLIGRRLSVAEQPASLVTIIGIIIAIPIGIILAGVATAAQFALSHFAAKIIFGATGTFAELTRPLLLGWFVNVLVLIPVAGIFIAGIAWIVVLMITFQEVDGIERMEAFGISVGVGLLFQLLGVLLKAAVPAA